MTRVPFDEQAWLAGPAAGSAAYGEAGFSTLERLGARPTAEVNGMWGGYTGPGAQDDHPGRGAREDQLPAGGRPGACGRRRPGPRLGRPAAARRGSPPTCRAEKAGVAPCASDLDSPAMAALRRAIAPGLGRRSRRGALPPGGRQRTGGRPRRAPRRSAAVPGCGAAHRPDPLAQRAGAAVDAAPRRRGGRAPVARTRGDPRRGLRLRPRPRRSRRRRRSRHRSRRVDVRPPAPHRAAARDGGGLAHRLRGDRAQARAGRRRPGRGAPLRRRTDHRRALRPVRQARATTWSSTGWPTGTTTPASG